MSKFSHEKLLEALDLHHNLLFAEKQAISARDLNTVEHILKQKDQSMELLLLAKDEAGCTDYPFHIESRISKVLKLQQQNTENFRRLQIQDENQTEASKPSSPLFRRFKQAYSR